MTGARRAHADVLGLWAPYTGAQPCAFTTVLLAPPAAPAAMQGMVVDRQVLLEWHGAADATGYEVQAGSAPGLQNLATLRTGGAATLQVDAVPPGTYFVRVVGINDVGRSAASAEIVVAVR